VAKPASGSLPANRAGVLVSRAFEDFEYELRKVNGASSDAVTATETQIDSRTVLIAPTTPWVEGEEYVLLASSCAADTEEPLAERARFTIGPSAELPTTLGSIDVEDDDSGSLWLIGGPACTEEFAADSAEVTLVSSESAEAWQGALVFEVLVDGEPYRDGTKNGLNGSDVEGPSATVYRLCVEGSETLSEGTHEVQFRATLPGTELSLTSEAAEVELHCDDETGSAGAAGASSGGAGNSGGTSSSGGTSHSGGAASGGQASGGGGQASGGQANHENRGSDDSSDDGGCSVSAAPSATSGMPWLLAALGAFAAQRRNRRRARKTH
jgi:MYXO-CTERM domain-containing protein